MSNSVSRYISNVKKAAGELSAAAHKADVARRTVGNIKGADKKAKEEVGQFLGTVLQNRTYVDRKTGRAK